MVRAKQPGDHHEQPPVPHPGGRLQRAWAPTAIAPQLDPKYGDFITPEQHIPATGMPGVDWETCMTLNTTWGYSEHDHAWKSDETLIRNLIDIASKGGNYLLNIGPKGDGSVPRGERQVACGAIGAWMKVNGESIYATSASPFAQPRLGPLHPEETGQRRHAAVPARLRLAGRRPARGVQTAPAADARHAVGRRHPT